MRTFTFTPQILAAIGHERYHHRHPRVQQKLEVLWLKSHGLTHERIAELAGVSRRSVQRYLDEFAAGGLEQIRRLPWRGKASALAAHRDSLEDYFLAHPPRSTREAQAVILQQTGIRRGLSQGRTFLKKGSAWAGARSVRFRPRPTRRRRRPS